MSLWLVLLGCSTSASDPLTGCWKMVERDSTECFEAEGVYRLDSARLGKFEGRWKRAGDKVEVQVGDWAPDLYEARIEGDGLVLAHAERGEKAYSRVGNAPQ
ncbi:MAG: hypothetical protein R3F61_25160 [Myxococcota bacterium]